MNEIERLNRSTKRSKKVCIFVNIMVFIILIIIAKYDTNNNNYAVLIVMLLVSFEFLCVSVVIWFVYKGIKDQNKYWIENEELKQTLPKEYGITQDEFTEVFLRYEQYENETYIKVKKKLGAKYYARLISYDEIEVALKDKDGDLLKTEHFTDFHAFESEYKPL